MKEQTVKEKEWTEQDYKECKLLQKKYSTTQTVSKGNILDLEVQLEAIEIPVVK